MPTESIYHQQKQTRTRHTLVHALRIDRCLLCARPHAQNTPKRASKYANVCTKKRQKIRGEQIGKNYDDIFVLVTVNIKVTKSMCVCAR